MLASNVLGKIEKFYEWCFVGSLLSVENFVFIC